MVTHGSYPLYSVDASAFIHFADYRRDVFPSMWQLVEDVVTARRLFICEETADECYDAPLRQIIDSYEEQMVVTANYTWDYLLRFQVEAVRDGIQLVNPKKTTDRADPFVVALALMLEQRNPKRLHERTNMAAKCVVISHEGRKGQGATWVKIPNACDHYGIECVDWQEFLKREGYQG